jgi:FKBP-type peptidyl-prolyl cis-trans isomerase FkpA
MKNSNQTRFAYLFLAIAAISMVACKGGSSAGKSASGYSYVFHKKGGTGETPKMGEFAYCNFIVWADTTQIFSSATSGQVARFPIRDSKKFNDLYRPLLEGLMMMRKGDSLTISRNIDTLKSKPAGFEKAHEMRYTIVLKDLKNRDAYVADMAPQEREQFELQEKYEQYMDKLGEDYPKKLQARYNVVGDSATNFANAFKSGSLKSQLKTTASGLQYLIVREGTGALPNVGDYALLNYYGVDKAGVRFDDSYQKGNPFSFPVGMKQVIPGWDEGVALFKEGTVAVLFVPSKLGYGDKAMGAIAANSDLIFYVETLKYFAGPKMQPMPQEAPPPAQAPPTAPKTAPKGK